MTTTLAERILQPGDLVLVDLDPWPTKVFLPAGLGAAGAVLVDQARSIDRKARTLRSLGAVPEPILREVRSKLAALIGVRIGDASETSEYP